MLNLKRVERVTEVLFVGGVAIALLYTAYMLVTGQVNECAIFQF